MNRYLYIIKLILHLEKYRAKIDYVYWKFSIKLEDLIEITAVLFFIILFSNHFNIFLF